MNGTTILLLHGFASSGKSTKARFFADKFNDQLAFLWTNVQSFLLV